MTVIVKKKTNEQLQLIQHRSCFNFQRQIFIVIFSDKIEKILVYTMIIQEDNEDSLELSRKYLEIGEFYLQILEDIKRYRNNLKIYMEECSQMSFIISEQITTMKEILNNFEKVQHLINKRAEGENGENQNEELI